MSQLFLIAEIAGTEVAISSDTIESVVRLGDLVDVPKCDPLVTGIFALRSRVLTLLDCQFPITGKSVKPVADSYVVVVNLAGHSYGLAVDAVRDVVSITPQAIKPAPKLDSRWARISHSIVEIEGRILMIVSPELLLAPSTAIAA